MNAEIEIADARIWLERQLPAYFDSCVTDPPYEIDFFKEKWDSSGIACDPAFWQLLLRVLKPGAHVLAFGHPRTFHRMMVAIEDAGFELRDTLIWLYAQGFGHGVDISKEIDRLSGHPRREITGGTLGKSRIGRNKHGYSHKPNRAYSDIPITDAAKQWNGWKSTLSPAWEAIILARKPLSAPNVAENVLRWGVGAINCNLGECWPRNVMVSEEVAEQLDAHSRRMVSRFFFVAKPGSDERDAGLDNIEKIVLQWCSPNTEGEYQWDSGGQKVTLLVDMGASPPLVTDVYTTRLNDATEWNTFLFGKPTKGRSLLGCTFITKMEAQSTIESKTLRWLVRLLTKESTQDACSKKVTGGDPVENAKNSNPSELSITNAKMVYPPGAAPAASGTQWKISAKGNFLNFHNTVKPMLLIRQLVQLITPPGGRVVDPFLGSGTTACAAVADGFSISGCELDPEYAFIARHRLEYWISASAD